MKGSINKNDEERLRNTISKDSKKFQDDIQKFEIELGQIENKLMVIYYKNFSQKH